jgi:hypothetical protein
MRSKRREETGTPAPAPGSMLRPRRKYQRVEYGTIDLPLGMRAATFASNRMASGADPCCIVCDHPLNGGPLVSTESVRLFRCSECETWSSHPRIEATLQASIHDSGDYFEHPYFKGRRGLSEPTLYGTTPRNGAWPICIGYISRKLAEGRPLLRGAGNNPRPGPMSDRRSRRERPLRQKPTNRETKRAG